MLHFLLIYDHKTRQLCHQEVFAPNDADAATAAYQQAEARYGEQAEIEIVLIGADSIETIQRTHGHYFDSGDIRSRYMRAV